MARDRFFGHGHAEANCGPVPAISDKVLDAASSPSRHVGAFLARSA